MIVVSGGGLGGLAAGAALSAAGFEVRVVEAASHSTIADAGLVLGVNAVRMLEAIGLADTVERAGTVVHTSRIERPNGRPVASADFGGFRERYGRSVIALHRRALAELLTGLIPEGRLQLGVGVTSFEEADGHVKVKLGDGQTLEATLLVAADGVHSAARSALLGPVPIHYAGHTTWRGVAEGGVSVEPATMVERWGPGRRFGFVPLGDGRVSLYASCTAPQGESDGADPQGELQERFSDFSGPVPELIRALPTKTSLHRADVLALAPLDTWCRGRVTLLGDAAHAMTPESAQGASQTIEDAVVLAASLAASRDDLPAGAKAFEEVRRPRVATIASQSRSLGEMAHWRQPIARALRDVLISKAPGLLRSQSFDALYGVKVPELAPVDR